MKEIETRSATSADRDFVWGLNQLCYRDVIVRQFGKWDAEWQEANFDKKWTLQRYSIILGDDDPIGVLSISRKDDSVFLNEILVHPNHQNQGVGTLVMKRILTQAESDGMPVRLQVLKENPALSLYQRLGFRVFNTTDTHFQMEWLG